MRHKVLATHVRMRHKVLADRPFKETVYGVVDETDHLGDTRTYACTLMRHTIFPDTCIHLTRHKIL